MAPAVPDAASSPPFVNLSAGFPVESDSPQNYVVQATRCAFGAFGWLMGRSQLILPWTLITSSKSHQLQLGQEYTTVEVRMLTGTDIKLRVVCFAP